MKVKLSSKRRRRIGKKFAERFARPESMNRRLFFRRSDLQYDTMCNVLIVEKAERRCLG